MIFKTALNAMKMGLGLAIVFRYMATNRASLAGMMRWYRNEPTTIPCGFIFKLSPEFAPTLIQDGTVQARLGLYVVTGLLTGAGR